MPENLVVTGSGTRVPPSAKPSLLTFLLLMVLFLVLTYDLIQNYLLDLFMGLILAIIFDGIYEYLKTRKWPPWLAALTVTLGIFFLILGPLLTLLVIAVRDGADLAKNLGQETGMNFDLHKIITGVYRKLGPFHAVVGDPAVFERELKATLQRLGTGSAGFLLNMVKNIPGMVLDLILVLVVTCYAFIDGARLRQWLSNKIPLDADVRVRLLQAFKDTSVSTIWSAMAGALVQAGFLVVAFLITGIPAVVVAGGTAFILAWVPLIGSIPVWLLGIIYLYVQHEAGKAIILLVFGVVAGIGDNIVRPWVLKGRGDMHALVGLIAIFGGIDLFGIFGVFYGPILISVVTALLNTWPLVAKRSGIGVEPDIHSM